MCSAQRTAHRAKLDRKTLIRLYTTMVRIRRVEESLMKVFSAGEIPGFLHVCIGQEAAPAAVCGQLEPDDYIGTTHRGHGHALAKGIDLKLFMAELFGRKTGFCLGRSGSMHLADSSLGILGANGIVGGGIPITTGAALAAQYKYPGRVAVCFFGDGATGEGTFHESLNVAALWKLPVVYVCENNGWAEFTPRHVHTTVNDVADSAAVHGIPAAVLPNEVIDIHEAAGKAIQRARNGDGPSLLEVKCNRWHGHFVGDAQKYRGQAAVEEAMADDCLQRFEDYLIRTKRLDKDQASEIDRTVREEIAEAVDFARNSPAPETARLMEGLYP
ncbi:MAG: thiamine pyrophosphate-dependent dehydrogenase E1 component subunit alpha [Desulfomonilaceae bacterium]